MDLSGHIRDIITVATEMKQQPSADKKALNKTIARLEEAELWAGKVNSGKVQGIPQDRTPLTADQCICPEGAIVYGCPVHNTK